MKQNNHTQINKEVFRKSYNDHDSGKIFLVGLIVPFLLSLLFSMIAQTIADSYDIEKIETITNSLGYAIPYAICSALITIAVFFAYNKISKVEYRAIKLNFHMKWHTYLIIIAVALVSLFGIQYLIGGVDDLLKLIGFPVEEGLPIINPTSWGKYILAVFLLALLPAISEELIFRGVVMQGLRARFNDYCAVLLSASMFALMHGNLQQLVYPFLLGTIMGWIVVRTGSLVSSFIIHFINNLLTVTFLFIENMTGFSFELGTQWWVYILAIALFAVAFGIYYLIDRFYFKHKSHEEVEKTSTKTSKFVYISLAVSGLLFVIMTIIQFAGG